MNDNLRVAARAVQVASIAEGDMDAAKDVRDAAIWRARRADGLGPTEIANALRMSLPNVRRIIREQDKERGWRR